MTSRRDVLNQGILRRLLGIALWSTGQLSALIVDAVICGLQGKHGGERAAGQARAATSQGDFHAHPACQHHAGRHISASRLPGPGAAAGATVNVSPPGQQLAPTASQGFDLL